MLTCSWQAAVVSVRILRAPGRPAVHVQAVFACRHCQRLGYASQLETPYARGTGRARRIRVRLSDGKDDPFGEFPSRPRFMHRTTYERWHRAHDEAEDRSAWGLMNFVERLGRRSSRRA